MIDEEEVIGGKAKYSSEELAAMTACPKCGNPQWIKGSVRGVIAYKCMGISCGEFVMDRTELDKSRAIKAARMAHDTRDHSKWIGCGKTALPTHVKELRKAWGIVIKRARQSRGKTQKRMAAEAEMPVSTLSMLEKGRASEALIRKLAGMLNISASDAEILRMVSNDEGL